jgi:flavin-dependent dehydrogenase
LQIAVVGSGVAGSVFAVLAKRLGYDVEVYDMARNYVKPCGEVVPAILLDLLKSRNIPLPEVVDSISTFEFYDAHGRLIRRIERDEAVWLSIDKKKWVERLRVMHGGIRVETIRDPGRLAESYSLVVDARGPFSSKGRKIVVWRAYGLGDDYKGRALLVFSRKPFGLAWVFSSGQRLNIGGGFIGVKNPRELSLKLLHKVANVELIKGTDAYSLVTVMPSISLLKARKIVAIGEAAGLIQSLGGEGIRPAVESAIALVDALGSPRGDVSIDTDLVIRRYVENIRGLIVETRFASLLLAFAEAAGFTVLGKIREEFFDYWLMGRLRMVRQVLSSIVPI